MPSIGDVRAEYRFLWPGLVAAGFKVVTMDLRGHGQSTAGFTDYSLPAVGRDILALAHNVGSGQASIIGTPKAGAAAVWAAAQEPDAIDRLVLVSALVGVHSRDSLQKAVMAGVLSRPWGPALWAMHFPKLYPSRKPGDFDAYRATLKGNLRESGRIEALRAMMTASEPTPAVAL